MISSRMRLFGAVVALLVGVGGAASAQQLELKLMAPAAPGGGWDQTARSMQQALVAAGVARSVQVTNVPGAGGSVGIAQFVNGAKGDGSQMMVNGFVMVGALAMNKSPVTLDQVTPIARLTEEIQVIVVPANSPLKTAQDLAAAVKADIARALGFATAVTTRAMPRTWSVRLLAIVFTESVRSFHVPPTPSTVARPPSLPSVPTSRATRVTSPAKALS